MPCQAALTVAQGVCVALPLVVAFALGVAAADNCAVAEHSRHESCALCAQHHHCVCRAQYTPGTMRQGTRVRYLSQSAPYFTAHLWSSLRSRWMRSTAKYAA